MVSQKETEPDCLYLWLCEGCLCLRGAGKGMAVCLPWPGCLLVCVHVYELDVRVCISVSGTQSCYWLQLQPQTVQEEKSPRPLDSAHLNVAYLACLVLRRVTLHT